MTIKHPVTAADLVINGQPMRLKLVGADGDRWAKIRHMLDKEVRDYQRRVGDDEDPVEINKITHRHIAKAVIDWQGVLQDDGQPMPLSIEAAARLFREHPWVAQQADVFLARRANFIAAAPAASSMPSAPTAVTRSPAAPVPPAAAA